MAYHGILTRITAEGVRPINFIGQSVLGTVIETTLPANSDYNYNEPYYFTDRPNNTEIGLAEANGDLIAATQRSSQNLG